MHGKFSGVWTITAALSGRPHIAMLRNDRVRPMATHFPDTIVSRRRLLAAGTAGAAIVTAASTANAASFGNPDEPAEGAVNVTNPKALTDTGPQDPEPGRQRACLS